MPILLGLLLNLILIPVFWPAKSIRIPVYTILAVANVTFYLICMVLFFIRVRREENRHGFTLRFMALQLFLLTALFLFKLTELLISGNCL